MANAELAVEVVYALPERQVVVALNVPAGSSLYDAARLSGLAQRFGFDLEAAGLGVFGKLEKTPRERLVRAGERVEIYRPLLIDPKAARQARADKARAARAGKKPA